MVLEKLCPFVSSLLTHTDTKNHNLSFPEAASVKGSNLWSKCTFIPFHTFNQGLVSTVGRAVQRYLRVIEYGFKVIQYVHQPLSGWLSNLFAVETNLNKEVIWTLKSLFFPTMYPWDHKKNYSSHVRAFVTNGPAHKRVRAENTSLCSSTSFRLTANVWFGVFVGADSPPTTEGSKHIVANFWTLVLSVHAHTNEPGELTVLHCFSKSRLKQEPVVMNNANLSNK